MSSDARPSLRALADAPVAARVVTSAADLALVLDREGVILEVGVGDGIDPSPGFDKLVGQRWTETLTRESQGKVAPLLDEARDLGRSSRPRELNQKAEGIGEIPLRVSAVLLEDKERVVALGRDLRPVAALQQRMVTSQQAMDRDFGRLRQADARYRLLFHVASEGVLVADAATRKVLEANPAAALVLGTPAANVQGVALQDLFDPRSRAAVQTLLAAVDSGARPTDIQAHLRGDKPVPVTLSAFLFRQSGAALLLLRFTPVPNESAVPSGARTSRILAAVNAMPDGFVVTGEDRRILSANVAFCELVDRGTESQVLGEPLDRWVGRPGVDVNIILANLREHGMVKNFATVLRGDYGPPQEALVTAVSALDGKVPCLAFTIRAASSSLSAGPVSMMMPRSVDQLRELVGRVPLKDLVREAADLIERLCIVAALDVSSNNRASAAQLLGLSRQGLYSKLRRHKIAEFGSV